MNKKNSDIQLVITVALKKEIPKGWFVSRDVPVHTLSALKSGALKMQTGSHRGMLVIITGVGLKKSEEAARWIQDNLAPLFVLNIGTCGIKDRRRSLCRWIIPRHAADEEGNTLELDARLPVPYPEHCVSVNSLLSVKEAVLGDLPAHMKDHDVYDMECFAQAAIFIESGISFHSLKFSTDYSDHNACPDFEKHLSAFKAEFKKIFSFIDHIPPLTRGGTGGSLPLRQTDINSSQNNSIKITAIVPVFNREHTIHRAIDSILSQSYTPEEIIVVDDCSTDGTNDILRGYGDKITLIRLSHNSGPSIARNEGVKHARTEWIAFMDSDDSWKKDKLKKQADYLRKYPFYQIMQSDEIWIRNGKRVNPHKHHKKPPGWIWEQSLERCLVSPSGVLLKKSLLNQYGGFDESLPVCEDYDLWLKISRHCPVGLEPGLSVVKTGGHHDQLSRRFSAMDRFRVQSLLNMLKREPLPGFREKLIDILKKKLNVLMRGCEKRGKLKELRAYNKILNSLHTF